MLCKWFFCLFFAFMENSLLAYQNEERNDLFKASFVLDIVLDIVLEVCKRVKKKKKKKLSQMTITVSLA